MFHHWLHATDGTGVTVRTALLDFRKAFDLVDHNILVGKLRTLGVEPTAINWIIDFLRDRKQRVKLNSRLQNSRIFAFGRNARSRQVKGLERGWKRRVRLGVVGSR